MELTRYADVEWVTRRSLNENDGRTAADKTRAKVLHHGTPGKPGHFEMAVTTYSVPKNVKRHRHDTDQFRLSLHGESPWAPGHITPEGALLFIPSGTPYGPYERPVDVELLQVEFDGADGSQFVDIDYLAETKDRLAENGTFANGMFSWTDEHGEPHTKPELRALIEAATHRPQAMPRTRFSVPIELVPDHFAWVEVAPSVFVREFLAFPERGTRLWQLAIDAGASHTLTADQETLLFVASGTGQVDAEPIVERDSLWLHAGDEVRVIAGQRLEFYALGLPRAE